MPIVRYIKGVSPAVAVAPTPVVPDPPEVTLDDILTLVTARQQLRLGSSSGENDPYDAIVVAAVRSAVGFVADAADVTLAEIAASDTLKQAVIVATRHFFNGYEEIPPLSAIWSLINAGAPCR